MTELSDLIDTEGLTKQEILIVARKVQIVERDRFEELTLELNHMDYGTGPIITAKREERNELTVRRHLFEQLIAELEAELREVTFKNVGLSVTTEPRQIFDTSNVEVGDILTLREYKGAVNGDGSYSYSDPRNGIVVIMSSTGFTLAMALGEQQFTIDSLVAEKFFITGHSKHIEGINKEE